MNINIKTGPKPLSPYPVEIEYLIKDIYSTLSEKNRRVYAAIEALKLPRGERHILPISLVAAKIRLLIR